MFRIARLDKIVTASLVGIACNSLGAQCADTWTGALSSHWNVSGNWLHGCIPSDEGDSAFFTQPQNLSPYTVTADSGTTLTNLVLDITSVSYNLAGFLDFEGNGALIECLEGSHTLSAAVGVLSDISLYVNGIVDATGAFQFNSHSLTVTGTAIGALFTQNNLSNVGAITMYGGNWNAVDGFNGGGETDLTVDGGIVVVPANLVGGIYGLNNFVQNGGVIQIEPTVFPSTFSNAFTLNNGTFNLLCASESDGTLTTASVAINGGTLLLNAGALTSTGLFSISGGTVNLAVGQLAGTALQMTGGTVAVFNNLHSGLDFTSILMSGGKLVNDGFVDGTVNLTGGLVRGLGTFHSDFTNTAGTVEPGDIPGELSFLGNYTQLTGGTLQIDFLNPSAFGSIAAESADLGGTLKLETLGRFSPTPGEKFAIVTTSAGVSGRFAHIVESHFSSALLPHVQYDPDQVTVTFTETLPFAVAIKEMVLSNINQINYQLFNRLDRIVNPCCCICTKDWYVAPLGSVGTVHSKEKTVGYDFYTAGGMVGVECANSWYGYGGQVNYQRMHGNGFNRFGHFDLDQVHGSIYGLLQLFKCLYIDGILGGGYQWDTLHRRSGHAAELVNKAHFNAREFDGLFGLKMFWSCRYFSMTPFVDAQYIYYHIDRYRELDGGLFNLDFNKQRYESTRTTVGLHLDGKYSVRGLEILPSVNAAWQRELSQKDKLLVFNNPSPGFIPAGLLIPAIAEDTLLAGADVHFVLNCYLDLELYYELEWNRRLSDHFFTLSFNGAF